MDSRITKKAWEFVEIFEERQKAIDFAFWMNFKFRLAKITFGVFADSDVWCVCEEAIKEELGVSFTEPLPKDLVNMPYKHIQSIAKDREIHPHWDAIRGMFSVMDGELLRFIIAMNIPLEKFIRYELASRGHDTDNRWCGFEKAQAIWLEEKKK